MFGFGSHKSVDHSAQLSEQLTAALASEMTLRIQGGNTKAFYGNPCEGEVMDMSAHQGIVDYEPTELVITARAGTSLSVIEETLAQHRQMLPFEPPHLGKKATLGGAIACGLSGPRRAYAGAARDFVLGTKVLTGRGEVLSFGGQVMKNVAGYDVSRLMVGAMGTLGILLEVSLKVLPSPPQETTLALELTMDEAIRAMNSWASKPLPISATGYLDGQLFVRLSGTQRAVDAARQQMGGEAAAEAEDFWLSLREHSHEYFRDDMPLWRLSLAADTHHLKLPAASRDAWLLEWGGAQRWLKSEAPAEEIRAVVSALGGHATLFRGETSGDVFQRLPEPLMAVQRKLKAAFDPKGILNPGRLYRAF
jgi:glycolate oxidase FAD binding subunit